MPYWTGGNASGSPVLSDSSTRNTSGRMTRKATTSRTAIVAIACPLCLGRRTSPVIDVKAGSAPRTDDAVPLLGELRTVLLEGVPVGRNEELHVLERHAAGRRRHVVARRMQQQRVAERLLADRGEEPVHEQLGGVGMRAVLDDAVGLRHRGHAGLGEDEGERRALGLELDVARVLRAHDDLVLAVDQAAVLLDIGIEGARLVLGELLEVLEPEDRFQ